MEALAEQPAGVRCRAVIMDGKRPAEFALDPENAEIAALGGIAAERNALVVRLRGGRLDPDLAAALTGEAVRPGPPAGEVVGGEFPYRQAADIACSERIRGIMVLMAALEGRDPQRIDSAAARSRSARSRRDGASRNPTGASPSTAAASCASSRRRRTRATWAGRCQAHSAARSGTPVVR